MDFFYEFTTLQLERRKKICFSMLKRKLLVFVVFVSVAVTIATFDSNFCQ